MRYLLLLVSVFFMQFIVIANNSPQGFIENKGQIHDQNNKPNADVKYILPISGMNVLLKNTGFSYDTYKIKAIEAEPTWENLLNRKSETPKGLTYDYHRVDIEFIGANPKAEFITEGKSEDYLNYYGSGLGETGVVNIHSYQKVTYKNIYPNIDIEFISDKDNLKNAVEYNFILRPGANINAIKLKYSGANSIQLLNGKLNIKLAHGILTEAIPVSYWKRSGKKEKIGFSISKTNNETIISYEGLNKPITETLIIDPTPNLDWATYYGGFGENVFSVCNDNAGNLFAAGRTSSPINIATSGAYQSTLMNDDGFLVKFNSSGVRQWGTYYNGGGANTRFLDNAIDGSGNIYVSGETYGTGMATGGAHQTTLLGNNDAFLAKFNTAGVRQWATYYGGVEGLYEYGGFVSVDNSDNVYLSGTTSSSANIATSGAFQENLYNSFPYGIDAFLVKFNSSGVRQWGTYLGGGDNEQVFSMCSDINGNSYVTGWTRSLDSIKTTGAFQTTHTSGQTGFIIKMNSSGNRIWGTYCGTNGSDGIYDINSDYLGNVLVVATGGATNLISTNASQLTPSQTIIGKFNSSGTWIWGTYLGSWNPATYARAICSDSIGGVYVTGYTFSSVNVATPGCYQGTLNGFGDAFIVKYDSAGSKIFGTLYGGNDGEACVDICTFSQNEIYVSGDTYSTSGLTTPWGHQPTCPNPVNPYPIGMIAKFSNIGAVGINEFTNSIVENDILIYPNPNNGEFRIKCKEEMILTITNELGKVIQTINTRSDTSDHLKLNLNAGFYFVNGQNERTSTKQKVIVIK